MSISVTNKAWSKMSCIVKQSNHKFGFLYSAVGGGCNGFSFKLGLLDELDHIKISSGKFLNVLENETTKLYIDPLSEMHLMGTTIDYISEDYSKGQFENKFIFEVDKTILSSCGCGTSFSPK